MLGTGEGGGECCGKAIGEVNPSTLGLLLYIFSFARSNLASLNVIWLTVFMLSYLW